MEMNLKEAINSVGRRVRFVIGEPFSYTGSSLVISRVYSLCENSGEHCLLFQLSDGTGYMGDRVYRSWDRCTIRFASVNRPDFKAWEIQEMERTGTISRIASASGFGRRSARKRAS